MANLITFRFTFFEILYDNPMMVTVTETYIYYLIKADVVDGLFSRFVIATV